MLQLVMDCQFMCVLKSVRGAFSYISLTVNERNKDRGVLLLEG